MRNPAPPWVYGTGKAGDCEAVPGEARARSDGTLPTRTSSSRTKASWHIIRHYTHEAGVRSLEREIQNIAAQDGAEGRD